MKRLKVTVHGLVQGIGFRSEAQRQAEQLGLSGWVMNDYDGTVSLTAEGHEADLQKLLSWAKEGPPRAEVSDYDIEWTDATGEFEGFSVLV